MPDLPGDRRNTGPVPPAQSCHKFSHRDGRALKIRINNLYYIIFRTVVSRSFLDRQPVNFIYELRAIGQGCWR